MKKKESIHGINQRLIHDRGTVSGQYKTGRRIVKNTENLYGLRREPSSAGPCKCRDLSCRRADGRDFKLVMGMSRMAGENLA